MKSQIANQTFVIAGRFKQWSQQELRKLINSRGGGVNASVGAHTHVLLAGARAGASIAKAEALGIPVWDEETLTQHLLCLEPTGEDEPFAGQPLIRYAKHHYAGLYHLANQSVVTVNKSTNATEFAFEVRDVTDIHTLLDSGQAPAVKGLAFSNTDTVLLKTFIERAIQFSSLTCLLLTQEDDANEVSVSGSDLLANVPSLRALYVAKKIALKFDVVRHANLEELSIEAIVPTGLDLCSFPSLRRLELPVNKNVEYDTLLSTAFPALNHFGVHGHTRLAKHIKQLNLPESVRSIGLHYSNEHIFDDTPHGNLSNDIRKLTGTALATRLERLILTHDELFAVSCLNENNFPSLGYVRMTGNGINREGTYEQFDRIQLKEGWVFDLSMCALDSRNTSSLLKTLRTMKALGGLVLDFNHIRAKATLERLEKMKYPASFIGQTIFASIR